MMIEARDIPRPVFYGGVLAVIGVCAYVVSLPPESQLDIFGNQIPIGQIGTFVRENGVQFAGDMGRMLGQMFSAAVSTGQEWWNQIVPHLGVFNDFDRTAGSAVKNLPALTGK